MFRAMRKTLVGNRGSALFIVLVLVVGMAVILAALTMSNVTRSGVAERSNSELDRLYAAQAGLERLKMAIMLDQTNASVLLQNCVASGDPAHTMTIGRAVVNTFVDDLGTDSNPVLTWYMLRAIAVDNSNRVTELGILCRLCDTFGKYAMYSDTVIDIGPDARYLGNVHADGRFNTDGHIEYDARVTFEQDVTAKGTIGGTDKNADLTVTFMKKKQPFAPQKPRPTSADVMSVGANPPPGTIVYDWNNADFKTKFQSKTGILPTSPLTTTITFNVANMTVVNVCSGKSMTETIPIPNDNFIYCAGTVSLQGHVSRRTSVLGASTITVTGPVRYVDDSNQPQYILYKKEGGIANFSNTDDMWAPVVNWKGGIYDYRQADDWGDRVPVIDGYPQNPSLGIVSVGNIIIDNGAKFYQKNVEIHAAMYSCNSVEMPSLERDDNGHNLMLLGTRVQKGSSPNSRAWHDRHYTYDENLWVNPPPGFPTCIDPSFCNWHIVQSGDLVQ